MITMTGLQIEQYMAVFMFASLRVFGLFLTAPMFSFRTFPMQFRLFIALAFGVYVMPMIANEVGSIANPFAKLGGMMDSGAGGETVEQLIANKARNTHIARRQSYVYGSIARRGWQRGADRNKVVMVSMSYFPRAKIATARN